MRLSASLAALLLALAIGAARPAEPIAEAPTVRRYFGEPIPLPPGEMAAFDRGARLFVTDWSRRADGMANAHSCLDCHSVPMPAGSGMSDRALVSVDPNRPPGARDEVVQRRDPAAMAASVRRTPALFGIGFLESARGRDGRASFRLGVHARQSSLRTFVSNAFATELGVSTGLSCARKGIGEPYPLRCKPRVTEREVNDVLAYLRYLAPPARPLRPVPAAVRSFEAIGCTACHKEELRTTAPGHSARAMLIRPFTDLAVHDIGTSRKGAVRTAPLWGLGSYGPPYLNDGSAGTIEAAILAHGAEAAATRARYERLPKAEREALLTYLRSF